MVSGKDGRLRLGGLTAASKPRRWRSRDGQASEGAMLWLRFALLALLCAAAGCGRVGDLKPAPGHSLPIKPMMARATPDAEALLTPPTYARPDRIDELLKRSEPRRADPFDLAPATGGAAPPRPAGSTPEPQPTDNQVDMTPEG